MRSSKESFYNTLPQRFNFKQALQNHHFQTIVNYKLYAEKFWKFAEDLQCCLQKETSLHEGVYTSPFSFYTITRSLS